MIINIPLNTEITYSGEIEEVREIEELREIFKISFVVVAIVISNRQGNHIIQAALSNMSNAPTSRKMNILTNG